MPRRRRTTKLAPAPVETPPPAEPGSCLSAKQGGKATCKTYCLYYYWPPEVRSESVLCSGVGLWPPCVDYERCMENIALLTIQRVHRQKKAEALTFEARAIADGRKDEGA